MCATPSEGHSSSIWHCNATDEQLATHSEDSMRQQASAGRESSRLLVVDDDDGVRGYVARVLSEAGYQVETAANGAEGLKVVHSGATFDLIVSDVRMPQMTGPEFIAELRRQETDIKVLYLTGYVDQLFMERET